MKILLIEDDQRIANAVAEALSDRHYVVEIATDGQDGLYLAKTFTYDLIILDIILPKLDGISLCQNLRSCGDRTLILMLTSKDASADMVTGLDIGADDYVVKPFDMKALLARIRALLRRNNTSLPPVLEWEKLSLDPNKCEVQYNGQLINLTPKEYALLELFLRNSNRILNRTMIVDNLWSFEALPGEETVKVHLRSLRKKLRVAGAPSNLIETVYGLGYRLNPNI